MFEFVYKSILSPGNSRIAFHFWFHLKRALVAIFSDPSCTLGVHGRMLKMPLSHALPLSLNLYPFYDKLPCRLSDFIYHKYGHLNLIDVGANIGDTIAAFYRHDSDKFLAIEPNPNFLSYLTANFDHDPNVEILSCMCSSGETTSQYHIHEHNGTASLKEAETGAQIESKTIDDLVMGNPVFHNFNVIKIDTDGYDLRIIAGAINIIKKNKPAILFEVYDNESPTYCEDCINTLLLLKDAGYDSFLLYDRLGYLMGQHHLNDLFHFKQLLTHQITSDIGNTDILVMKSDDMEQFHLEEVSAFK